MKNKIIIFGDFNINVMDTIKFIDTDHITPKNVQSTMQQTQIVVCFANKQHNIQADYFQNIIGYHKNKHLIPRLLFVLLSSKLLQISINWKFILLKLGKPPDLYYYQFKFKKKQKSNIFISMFLLTIDR